MKGLAVDNSMAICRIIIEALGIAGVATAVDANRRWPYGRSLVTISTEGAKLVFANLCSRPGHHHALNGPSLTGSDRVRPRPDDPR